MLRTFLCQGGVERFEEAVNFNDVLSKNDSETKPYESKYQANKIWMELKQDLEKITDEEPSDDAVYLMAVLCYKLGTNCCDTDELTAGQEHLNQCIKILEDKCMEEKACTVLLQAYNGMGVLWSLRRDSHTAREYLIKAEKLYDEYRAQVGNAPFALAELFSVEEPDLEKKLQVRIDSFEEAHTYTFYYLAQVYTRLGDKDKAAEYCQYTLQRQLSSNTYTPIDWALNAATLSQYYLDNPEPKRMVIARHCLASAERILLETGEPVLEADILSEDSQVEVDIKEKLPRTWADLYRCWIKYGISILDMSMNYLIQSSMADTEGGTHNAPEGEDEAAAETTAETKETSIFDLELTDLEEKVTHDYVKIFEEARKVFLVIQHWINKAKEFYQLDGFCSDYVELVQDQSMAFKLLSFFELDLDRQCKMQKRRIDMLQETLKQLNPQFYLMICRQLMYETAETYMAMLDLKIAIIEESGTAPTPHAVKKINSLAKDGLKHYGEFVRTLKDSNKKLPSKYAEENERPALVAFFCMGRLHSKYLGVDKKTEIENVGQSLECYKYLVDYCNENPSARDKVRSEYEVCQEMVLLLPKKQEKLLAQLQNM